MLAFLLYRTFYLSGILLSPIDIFACDDSAVCRRLCIRWDHPAIFRPLNSWYFSTFAMTLNTTDGHVPTVRCFFHGYVAHAFLLFMNYIIQIVNRDTMILSFLSEKSTLFFKTESPYPQNKIRQSAFSFQPLTHGWCAWFCTPEAVGLYKKAVMV